MTRKQFWRGMSHTLRGPLDSIDDNHCDKSKGT